MFEHVRYRLSRGLSHLARSATPRGFGASLQAALGLAVLVGCAAPPAPEPLPLEPRAEGVSAFGEALEVTTKAVAPPPGHDGLAGSDLRWRAGFVLTSDHDRFGGFSGLLVEGERLLAISDRGWWWRGVLRHDAAGTLLGVGDGAMGVLQGVDGRPLDGLEGADAEELARCADGVVVSYEREHRLQFYHSGGALALDVETPSGSGAGSSRLLASPPVAGLDENGGFEALTRLADGRLLVFVEGEADAGGHLPVFLSSGSCGGDWQALRMQATGVFKPTAATTLPGGGVLLVERTFHPLTGVRIRLSRISAGQLEAALETGRPLISRELGRLAPPLPVDNMEAVDVAVGPAGETLVYLLADDNFNQLQATLLLQLELSSSAD